MMPSLALLARMAEPRSVERASEGLLVSVLSFRKRQSRYLEFTGTIARRINRSVRQIDRVFIRDGATVSEVDRKILSPKISCGDARGFRRWAQILRAFGALVWMSAFILAGMAMQTTSAQVIVSPEAVSQYVLDSVEPKNGYVTKWTDPVRYNVSSDMEVETEIILLIRQAVEEIQKLTNLDIAADSEANNLPPNMIFFFLQDIGSVLSIPLIRHTFVRAGETDAAYTKRMREDFNHGWLRYKASSKSSVGLVIHIVNTKVPRRQMARFIFEMVFTSFVPSAGTNAIMPSVLNFNNEPLPVNEYPKVDQSYLRAVYSKD
jgi:hypothetical protein